MSTIALVLLLAAVAGWAALPLLPALRELLQPTDTRPLSVVGRDAGDTAFFARGFREYLHSQLSRLRVGSSALPDGTPVLWAQGNLTEEETDHGVVDRVVVAARETRLPAGAVFFREVYGRGSLEGGEGATYRAVLAEGGLKLGPGSTMLRWAHAVGHLEAGRGSALNGRSSSETSIRLGADVGFERIAAPRIEIGPPASAAAATAPPETHLFALPGTTRALGDHRRVSGNLSVPADARVEGHLVVTGALRLGANARVAGNAKVHGDVALGEGASVGGSLVTRASVRCGAGCRISGPIIAEGQVHIGRDSVIGSPGRPTTISAPRVVLTFGAVVHGMVIAQDSGTTSAT